MPNSPIRLVSDLSAQLGKLPPQAPEMEESVLGALLCDKNAMMEVAGILRPEHFYTEAHQEIYRAIMLLFSAGDPIDMRTVANKLRELGKLELIGGSYAIADISSKIASGANIEYHARIVIEHAMKRSLITLGSGVLREAYEDTANAFGMIEWINSEIQTILDHAISGRAETSAKDVAVEVVQQVQARASGIHTGLDTGFEALDRITNGLNPTDLIVVAARPGMGKSAVVVQAGKQVAERGMPVGIFSLEMSKNQLIERLAIAEAEIDSDKIKKGKLSEFEFSAFMDKGIGSISRLPLWIDDTPMLSIIDLRARAMRMKSKYGVGLVIVDYLQLVRGLTEANSKLNRDQEIGLITRTLKGMAKELELPVIAVSQLSRSVETRGGTKRPMLSDLRESGSIEQDADIVIFLYRPEYYHINQDENGMSTHGLCEAIVAKHRNGATDTALLKFVGRLTKFKAWDAPERLPFDTSGTKDPSQSLQESRDIQTPF